MIGVGSETAVGRRTRAAEETNFKRLRLRPENIDSDSNSDPLRPNMRQFKKNNMMQPFSWFGFRLNPTSDTAIVLPLHSCGTRANRQPLVLTADTAGRVYHWFILMWSVWQSEFIGNHNMIAMALKLSRLFFTRRISIPEWRSNLFYTLPLSLSSHRSMLYGGWITFGRNHRLLTGDNLQLRAGVGVSKIYRLQLQLQPKRSTPTDSSYGLDSDSAALRRITPRCIRSWHMSACSQATPIAQYIIVTFVLFRTYNT